MRKTNIKNIIDMELRDIRLSEDIKNNIRNGFVPRRPTRILKSIAAIIVIIFLGGTTVAAGYYLLNRILVNEEILPELDSMKIVQINKPEGTSNENGIAEKDYNDYASIKDELGIHLLDTELSKDHPYMQGHIMTDMKDFAIITVDNFIIGDTSNYQFIGEENRYSYDKGEEYFSPISLTIDLILSEDQLNNGWDTEYLGQYRFVESYTMTEGYTVNIVEDNAENRHLKNYVSEKAAIFVVDGIRYTLKGRTTINTIKLIVDTMN